MKNRYLLIFGAKTTGANHRTFQFLKFRKVHQERAFVYHTPTLSVEWSPRSQPTTRDMNECTTSKYSSTEHVHQKVRSLENRDYVLTIVKLLLSKTKPLNTIAKHNTYQTITNHHFTDRHLHQKNDLVIFETPRLSNCFVINFAKTHI